MARGDHLFYYRGGVAYSHHAICCGDGTVVHYESSAWMKLTGGRYGGIPRIVRVSFEEFSQGQPVLCREYGDADPVEVVMQRALERIGEASYDLFENNCEHFAVWCKTGRAESTQVEAHRVASRAVLKAGPFGMTVLRAARRVPGVYGKVATAGAVAVAGSIYAGTYLRARQRDMGAKVS